MPPLLRANPEQIFSHVARLHTKYCALIEHYMPRPAVGYKTYPRAEFFLGKPQQKRHGYYTEREHRCRYAICYALVDPNFEETIAHEVCHAYQTQLYPACIWHGELFYYLLREVCGFKKAGRLAKNHTTWVHAKRMYMLLSLTDARKVYDYVEIPLQNIRSNQAAENQV